MPEPTPSAPASASPAAPAAPIAWIEVRVGDPAPSWRVGGLPLLNRLARQLAARGVGEVRLVLRGGDEDADRFRRAAGGAVAVALSTPEEVPDDAALLQGNALYDGPELDAWARTGEAPAPRLRVTGARSRADAEAVLWASVRKSLSHDGPVAYYLARPLATPITRFLARTPITPNAVTLFGLLVALGCGGVAALGGYFAGVAAAGLFFVGLLLDCVDGDLARITLTTSRLGQWLDTVTDDLGYAALAVGLGVGLTRDTGAPLWLWLGLATLALVVVGQGVIYRWLVRSGGPIDTAKYPWFFMGDAGLAQEEERSLVGWLSFAARRDSLTLVFVGLAVANLRVGILAVLAAGSAAYFVLLAVDLVAKASRRSVA